MTTSTLRHLISATTIVLLLGLLALFATNLDGPIIAVSMGAAVVLTGCVIVTVLIRHGSPAMAGVTVLSAVGLVSAEAYLHAIPADSAAIPLVGVGCLFLCAVLLPSMAVAYFGNLDKPGHRRGTPGTLPG